MRIILLFFIILICKVKYGQKIQDDRIYLANNWQNIIVIEGIFFNFYQFKLDLLEYESDNHRCVKYEEMPSTYSKLYKSVLCPKTPLQYYDLKRGSDLGNIFMNILFSNSSEESRIMRSMYAFNKRGQLIGVETTNFSSTFIYKRDSNFIQFRCYHDGFYSLGQNMIKDFNIRACEETFKCFLNTYIEPYLNFLEKEWSKNNRTLVPCSLRLFAIIRGTRDALISDSVKQKSFDAIAKSLHLFREPVPDFDIDFFLHGEMNQKFTIFFKIINK